MKLNVPGPGAQIRKRSQHAQETLSLAARVLAGIDEQLEQTCWADMPSEHQQAGENCNQVTDHPSGLCDYHRRVIVGEGTEREL